MSRIKTVGRRRLQLSEAEEHDDLEYGSYEEMILKHAPNVVMGLSLVEYGYQVDVWERKSKKGSSGRRKNEVNTYHCTTECRDFGGDYKIPALTAEFLQRFWDLVAEFQEGK